MASGIYFPSYAIWSVNEEGYAYFIEDFKGQIALDQYIEEKRDFLDATYGVGKWYDTPPEYEIYHFTEKDENGDGYLKITGESYLFYDKALYEKYIIDNDIDFYDEREIWKVGEYYSEIPQFMIYNEKGDIIRACLTEEERELYMEAYPPESTRSIRYYTKFPTYALYDSTGSVTQKFLSEAERNAYMKEHPAETYQWYTERPSFVLYWLDVDSWGNKTIKEQYFLTSEERDLYVNAHSDITLYDTYPEYKIYLWVNTNSAALKNQLEYVFTSEEERDKFLEEYYKEYLSAHPDRTLADVTGEEKYIKEYIEEYIAKYLSTHPDSEINGADVPMLFPDMGKIVYDLHLNIFYYHADCQLESIIPLVTSPVCLGEPKIVLYTYDESTGLYTEWGFSSEEELEKFQKNNKITLYAEKPSLVLYDEKGQVYSYIADLNTCVPKFGTPEERQEYIDNHPNIILYAEKPTVSVYNEKGEVVCKFLDNEAAINYIGKNPNLTFEKPTVPIYNKQGEIVQKFLSIEERDNYLSTEEGSIYYADIPSVVLYDTMGNIIDEKFADEAERDKFLQTAGETYYTEKPTVAIYDEEGNIVRKFGSTAERDEFCEAAQVDGTTYYTEFLGVVLYDNEGNRINRSFPNEEKALEYANNELGGEFHTTPPVIIIVTNYDTTIPCWTMEDFHNNIDLSDSSWKETISYMTFDGEWALWDNSSPDDTYELERFVITFPSESAAAVVNEITITEVFTNREDYEGEDNDAALNSITDSEDNSAEDSPEKEEDVAEDEEELIDAIDPAAKNILADADTDDNELAIDDDTAQMTDGTIADAEEDDSVSEDGDITIEDGGDESADGIADPDSGSDQEDDRDSAPDSADNDGNEATGDGTEDEDGSEIIDDTADSSTDDSNSTEPGNSEETEAGSDNEASNDQETDSGSTDTDIDLPDNTEPDFTLSVDNAPGDTITDNGTVSSD